MDQQKDKNDIQVAKGQNDMVPKLSVMGDDDIMKDLQDIENDAKDNKQQLKIEELDQSKFQQEKQLFLQTKKELEEIDQIDWDDRIFKRICTEDELKKMDVEPKQCYKCQKSFNLLTKKNQCKFCGQLVCQDHSRKNREDPQTKGSFVKICDQCEEKYLKYIINREFKKKKDKYDDMQKQLESKIQQILDQKKQKQEKLDKIKLDAQQIQNKYIEDQMSQGQKQNKLQQEIKAYEQQFKEMKDKIDQLDDKITDVYEQIEEKKKIIHFKAQKEKELGQKIIAITEDINEAQQIIDDIEKKIADNNQKLEKLKVFKLKEEQKLQQLASQNKQEVQSQQQSQQQQQQNTSEDIANQNQSKDQRVLDNPSNCVNPCIIF